MAFSKLTTDLNIIAALADEPNDIGGLSAAQLKAKFDESGLTIQTFVNALVDALNAVSAAASVGFTAITGVNANNVQAAIAQLQQNITEASQGSVPVGSITTAKLADLAATTAKLGELAVTTSKLGELAVTTSKLANLAVTAGKLAADSVETAKIKDSAVTEAKLGTSAVTTDKINAGAVTDTKIGTGAVTETKIASGAVSTTYTATIPVSVAGTVNVAVSGILATDTPIIDMVADSASATAERQNEAWSKVYKAVTSDNSIAFYLSDNTDVAIPIQIKCVRK